MANKLFSIQNITDVKQLSSKQELINIDIYEKISNIEVKKSDTPGMPPAVKPYQFWYDKSSDQVMFRRPDGSDKVVG